MSTPLRNLNYGFAVWAPRLSLWVFKLEAVSAWGIPEVIKFEAPDKSFYSENIAP